MSTYFFITYNSIYSFLHPEKNMGRYKIIYKVLFFITKYYTKIFAHGSSSPYSSKDVVYMTN